MLKINNKTDFFKVAQGFFFKSKNITVIGLEGAKRMAVKTWGKPRRQSSFYEKSPSILVLQWLSLCECPFVKSLWFNRRWEQERAVGRKSLNPRLGICFHLTQYSVGSLHRESSDFFFSFFFFRGELSWLNLAKHPIGPGVPGTMRWLCNKNLQIFLILLGDKNSHFGWWPLYRFSCPFPYISLLLSISKIKKLESNVWGRPDPIAPRAGLPISREIQFGSLGREALRPLGKIDQLSN